MRRSEPNRNGAFMRQESDPEEICRAPRGGTSALQTLECSLDPLTFSLPLRQALLMLLQHMGRRFGGEVRIVELLLGLGDFAFDLLEFLRQACLLRRYINQAFHRQKKSVV